MSLKRNAIWNLAGMGLPLLLGVVAIPYLYHHLGTEKIGILTLVWALIGYFSLFDFGLGRALTQQVSVARANDQASALPGLIKIGLLFTASTGLLGGIVMAIVSGRLGTTWLNVSAAMQQAAVAALLIAAVGIPMTTVTTGLRGVLEAYEEFASVNLLRIALGMSNFGLPMLSVLWFGPSLQWVIASLVGARCVLLIAHLMLINRKLPRGWYRTPLNIAQCRQLFSFGAWITVSNIIGPLMVTADRFIISAVLGASLVAYYSVPSDMLLRVLILPVALTAALFPRLASVMVIDPRAARQLYVRSLRLVALVMTPTCLAIGRILLGPIFLARQGFCRTFVAGRGHPFSRCAAERYCTGAVFRSASSRPRLDYSENSHSGVVILYSCPVCQPAFIWSGGRIVHVVSPSRSRLAGSPVLCTKLWIQAGWGRIRCADITCNVMYCRAARVDRRRLNLAAPQQFAVTI